MKALSLKQPWAELIVSGKKIIEIRKWNTKFRGEFLIHASKNLDIEAMKRFGFSVKELPLGKIVGKACLVDVKNYKKLGGRVFEKDKEKHLAGNGGGSFGFILKNPERIKVICARGRLGFWDFKLPKEAL